MPRNWVLFGGSGFIGMHLARHLLEEGGAQQVLLADLAEPDRARWPAALGRAEAEGRLRWVRADVRQPLTAPALAGQADAAANLAAVHREPGHAPQEYFATNLPGAEQVCAWAERTGCPCLVFVSSISVYGPAAGPCDEQSLPAPDTPYGASKLVGEHIHRAWQRADPRRRLLIVRPGVVFGPGEGGNVTRLVRAVAGGYFLRMGRQATPKAGGYVKEFCHTLTWALARMAQTAEPRCLLNFTAQPPPTVADYVAAARRVTGSRRPLPRVPFWLVLAGASLIAAVGGLFGRHLAIAPARVRKLLRGNDIHAGWLVTQGYPFRYTLEEAFRDWRAERPEDWPP